MGITNDMLRVTGLAGSLLVMLIGLIVVGFMLFLFGAVALALFTA